MDNEPVAGRRYPLLEALMTHKGIKQKGMYTTTDIAELFDVSRRTIQAWVTDGKLVPRNLPGRGRFLAQDIEGFLQNSTPKGDRLRRTKTHEFALYHTK
jgi:hypothetical protein